MATSNLSTLTKSHQIVAAKRRARKEQIKEVVFDDEARREFLTGFHKRKLQKKEAAKKKAQEREKLERLEARREKRKLLAERAAQNAAEAEKAYGGHVDSDLVDEDDEDDNWDGITQSSSSDKGKAKAKEEEYEYEEEVATVTVVEDFDPHTLIHGPERTPIHAEDVITSSDTHTSEKRPRAISSDQTAKTNPLVKPKQVKYQTNAARKAERIKQRKRKAEKAERAGGKASRKRGSGHKKH